jgi:hypothetical protein
MNIKKIYLKKKSLLKIKNNELAVDYKGGRYAK